MVVIKNLRHMILFFVFFFHQAYVYAKGSVKFLLNLYHQEGDGGFQIYGDPEKEEVTVVEPMLFIDHEVSETTSINAHFVFDGWTAASDTELDGNTGASNEEAREWQSRVAGNIGITQDFTSWKWSSRLGISNEYDYKSINVGGSLEGHFAQDNFVLGITPQLFLDKAKDYDIQNNRETEYKDRTIWSVGLNASQLLSPSDILQVGFTYINMDGDLNNITNSVKVLSNPYGNTFSRMEERVPGTRKRKAYSAKWVHGFSDESAMHLGYRFYDDDWNISSHTGELGWRLSFDEDDTFLMVGYRYYTQDSPDFWAEQFAIPQTFMTSDSDMGDFDSHRLSVHYSHLVGDKKFSFKDWLALDFTDVEVSLGGSIYHRSNDLDAMILQAGISTFY